MSLALLPRKVLSDQLIFAGMLWLGLVAVTAAVIAGNAYWGEVESSMWDDISTQLPRWFVLFIGVYFANTMLPLYVAHGLTRREVAVQGAVFVLLYAGALAVMGVAGIALETLVYRAADWQQAVNERTLYDSATSYPLIFAEYWLAFAVWTAAGAFAGAVFYRYENELGGLAVVLAAVPVTICEVALDTSWGRVGRYVFDRVATGGLPDGLAVLAAIAICLAALILALAMAWPVVRDIPLRPRKA